MQRRTFLAAGIATTLRAAPEIPRRVLGRTGLSVSLLGFGCAPGFKGAALYRRAIELGVNYFHVGDRTPVADVQVLSTLRPFRKQVTIGLMMLPGAVTVPALDAVLAATGIGHIDILYLITPRPEHLEGAPMEALEAARKAGKVRFAGITTHRLATDTALLTAPGAKIDAVMLTYNFLSPPDVSRTVGQLHAAGLGITPMKTMGGAFKTADTGVPSAILRWLAADTRVHCAPVAVETVAQLEQDVAAFSRPFSDADRELLKRQHASASPLFCRMCGACDGRCPRGVAVSDLVRCAMYAEGYGDLRRARAELARLPRAGCEGCERCVVVCPNGVAVRDRIRRALLVLNGGRINA